MEKNSPYNELIKNINKAREEKVYNSSAHRLSDNATFNGYEVMRDSNDIFIKMYQAANNVFCINDAFSAENPSITVNIRAFPMSSRSADRHAFFEALREIRTFIDEPLEERRKSIKKEG